MKSPDYLDYIAEREQELNIVVLRDVVDRIKNKPLTKKQEERVKKIIGRLYYREAIMNQVGLVGRLTRDPELRYTQGGTAYCRFTLAVDRGLGKEKREEAKEKNLPTADFISCQAWGKTAEIISNYVAKGHLFSISGTIQTGRYEKDGHTVYTTDVVVRSFDFIQSRGSGQQESRESSYKEQKQDDDTGFYPIDNEDIPF